MNARSQSVVDSGAHRRLKAGLDAVPAIDTHDHLRPFEKLPGLMETDCGLGRTLFGLWRSSYYPHVGALTTRQPGEPFDPWWARAQNDSDDARTTGFYRYQLAAFLDLYGVDFDRITDEQGKKLDAEIFDNYRDERWVRQVVTERADIGLPFQIHTGHGKLQRSNPILLLDLIEANPKTKFILFHRGCPWVGETGTIVLRHGRHVWVDSVWLPTISPTMARRTLHEWLKVMPSDRILWGAVLDKFSQNGS